MGGILYGLGVGPGDPGLVTIKAAEILRDVPVLVYLEANGGDSLARSIVGSYIAGSPQEIAIQAKMIADCQPAHAAYDKAAKEIVSCLKNGLNVAMICEGDPFFYGSFMYIFDRISDRFQVRVIAGVSSLVASAAAASMPLVSRNEILTVLPAPLPEDQIERRLSLSGTTAIIKVGRHLGKVRNVLRRLGMEQSAKIVIRAGMDDELVSDLGEMDGDEAPYFSMILVRKPDPAPAVSGPLPKGAALVVLDMAGLETARRLVGSLPGSRIHGLAGRIKGADIVFDSVAKHLQSLFVQKTPIIGVCAAGILVRALAPVVADKRNEPPVLSVSCDGNYAVPLLGGHNGANRLATAVAVAIGGQAAITTASDCRFGFGLDDPPPGWRIGNPDAAKAVTTSLLAGGPVALKVEAGNAKWLEGANSLFSDKADMAVRVTDRICKVSDTELVLRPPVLSLGIGCERGTEPDEVIALAEKTLSGAGLSVDSVACVVSIDLKSDEAAVHSLADHIGVPARFFTADELEAEAPRLAEPSATVFKAVGCHGVAEGAALAAVGQQGELVVSKKTSKRATCAVASSPDDLGPDLIGRPRGRLAVVGTGPGAADWRTPEVTQSLAGATDIVGYVLYLDIIADVIEGKHIHQSKMTEEEQRVRKALDLAGAGKSVALVSSGDAGIYALASLAFELLDREDNPAWNRIEISVNPGVSALQAAAARAGAPIGHDFCTISLSDLLTPFEDIERRIKAAADGDFIIAFYNPVSKRRRTQLVRAVEILLAARPADTPVVLARNLGRNNETLKFIRLDKLTPDHADMLTMIIIGNSHTRLIERGGKHWVYTPRGYKT